MGYCDENLDLVSFVEYDEGDGMVWCGMAWHDMVRENREQIGWADMCGEENGCEIEAEGVG